MSARRQIISALSEDSLGGIATMEDVAHAEHLADAYRAEVLNEQGPDDQETLDEAAQMYRNLRPVIERTMAEPDRWDGDEDEAFHLGRYVEWLAAERTQARAEVLAEAADFVGNDDECDCGGCDSCVPRKLADGLRALAGGKASASAPTATPASPVFDPLPSYLHSIGHAGSETEQGLYAAYRQAIAEVARLQAKTGDRS